MVNNLGNHTVMARNLKYYLDKSGKSRPELCRDLNIKYSTLADWLHGKTYPRIDKIEMLASYFGIQKSDLVEAHPLEGGGYYIDEDAVRVAQFLFLHPSHRPLFEAVMNVRDEDADLVLGLIGRLSR